MLEPKNVKFRKEHKKKVCRRQKEIKLNVILKGDWGLVAVENGRITARQLEAGRRTIKGVLKKEGKVWLGVFPDRSFTKKPAEVRMGKGKGGHEYWGVVVLKGRVLFEIGGVSDVVIKKCLRLVGEKMPIKTRIIRKRY